MMDGRWWWAVMTALVLVLARPGCDGAGDDDDDDDDDDVTDDDDDSAGDDDDTAGTSEWCDDGLPRLAWDPSAATAAYDQLAPDFTAATLDGEFVLSEAWTGCDHYVVVIYNHAYGSSGEDFWASSIDELIDDSADNVHYLFLTVEYYLDEQGRAARVQEIEDRVDEALAQREQDVQQHWAGRFHYIVDSGRDIPLVDEILDANSSEVPFTIDRQQLIREGHSVSYYSNGNWVMQLRNVRYWARYLNGQVLLDAQLAATAEQPDVLVQRLADAVDIRAEEPFTWTLPDAATLEQYQTAAIDLRVACPGAGHPFADTCGEWDTVGSLWLCGNEECTSDGYRRVVKWITPYSSPGRWLIDITPELVPLAAGGELRFKASHGDNDVGPYTYKYTADLYLGPSDDGLRPFALETLIARGNYGFTTMDEAFAEPWVITPPPGTQKVELYVRISGHGADSPNYCGEFCTFEHTFDVNGTEYSHQYLMEEQDRCSEWVELGVTPNQGGTWHFDRSSWCPGWTIEEWRADVTDSFDLGGSNSIEHIPTMEGGQTPSGGNMDSRVELVFYH